MALQEQRERSGYRAGYEPSAPPIATEPRPSHSASSPYNDPEYLQYAHRRPSQPSQPGGYVYDSPRGRAMDIVGAMFKSAWKNSSTILRIDLRQSLRYQAPKRLRGGSRKVLPGASVSTGGPLYGGEAGGYGGYGEEDEYVAKDESLFGSIRGGGARLKLMQVWNMPLNVVGEGYNPWDVNFAFGANVVMDQGRVEPKFRLRAHHFALHLLPEPAIEMRGKWPLGDTNLAIYARYRVPFSGIGRFWESPNARLMVNFFHPLGTGVHLTPGGVQFDEHVIRVGEFTTMRVAAAVDFPKQFPLAEGEQPFGLRVTRLGVKSRIF